MTLDKKYSIEEIKELAAVFKNTPASTTLTAPTLHGPFHGNTAQYGIFSGAGVRPQRYTTLARPWSLVSILGVNRSEYTKEILEVMTGVTAASGTNATGFCGNPPTVGQGKVCQQIYQFGKYYIKTDLNAIPEIGQLRDRADIPAELLNAGPAGNPLVPDLMYRMVNTRSQLGYELWRIGVEFERTLDLVLVQGDATLASTNTHHGYIAEFTGLDSQIKTGYTDAVTGLTCPAMDSVVETFSANVNTTRSSDSQNIVQVLEDIFYALKQRAEKMGMQGVQWAIVCRQELFRSFVNQYICQYNNYSCAGAAGTPWNSDAAGMNAMRQDMLSNMFIPVMGENYPVVFTEGLAQTTPLANTFQSDMLIVPVSWAGIPLTRLEYFPMDNQYLTEFADFQGEAPIALNSGMWLAANRNTGLCKEYHFANKFRLILETPWLAGRLDDMNYTFGAQIRNAIPTASFYQDGGATYRS